MQNVIDTLKQKRIWIPLSIFVVLFFSIAACAFLLSRNLLETPEDTTALPFNEIMVASLDPDKRKHLSKAEFAYFDAEKYAAQKKYARARESFADAADEFTAAMGVASPAVSVILIRQAEFESKFGRLDDAEATLRKALANLPQGNKGAQLTFTANRWLGYVLQQHQKYSEAIPIFVANVSLGQHLDQSKHSSTEQNRRTALSALASCYIAAKQYDKASKTSQDLLALVQKQPDNKERTTEAWIELGKIQTYQGKYSEAIEYYNKALAVDPKCIEAFRMRGTAYSEMNQPQKAISEFTIIIQIDAKDINAYEWRAYVYELNGDKYKAIDDLTTAIKLKADDDYVYDSRARLLAGVGRYKEAIADYSASIDLDDNPWTYMYRGQAYDQLGQHQDAIADYTKALESSYFVKHPNRTAGSTPAKEKTVGAMVYEKRAKCYQALGQLDLAEADRTKSAQLDAAKPVVKGHS
jgi:tetratricopeptide (TPR) repeat protein